MWILPTTLAALTFLCIQCARPVDAVSFPLFAQRRSERETQVLLKRLGLEPRSVLRNYGDNSYYVNISLGGATFQALIDTGR